MDLLRGTHLRTGWLALIPLAVTAGPWLWLFLNEPPEDYYFYDGPWRTSDTLFAVWFGAVWLSALPLTIWADRLWFDRPTRFGRGLALFVLVSLVGLSFGSNIYMLWVPGTAALIILLLREQRPPESIRRSTRRWLIAGFAISGGFTLALLADIATFFTAWGSFAG
ncbi:MAG: hypothetical protein AAGG07_09425 [Planctomycetota bacterium]